MIWLQQLIDHPPSSLSALEQIVGTIDVDFAGGEGMGFVHRPHPSRRGRLLPAIARLSVRFAWDMYHQDHRRVRDMSILWFTLVLAVPPAIVAAELDRRFRGRTIQTEHGPSVEYGPWYRVDAPDGVALSWYAEKPEWAIPKAALGADEDFLATLVDRLITETSLGALADVLAPLVGATNGKLDRYPSRIYIRFRPHLPLARVLAALRWVDPVAFSTDVHMTSWRVLPAADLEKLAPYPSRLGHWDVRVELAEWPRDQPELPRRGASPRYDMRRADAFVRSIEIEPPANDEEDD